VPVLFEAFIGLRYLRAKRRNSFISFISTASMIGIALGVAAMIIVLSVMNGFQNDIRYKTLSVVPHLEVTGSGNRLENWQQTANALQLLKHVRGAAPVVNSQVLFMANGSMHLAVLRGVDPALEAHVVDVEQYMVAGHLASLKPGEFGIVLGRAAASQMGLGVGDKLTVFSSESNITPFGTTPRSKVFTVVGLFHVGLYDVDSSFALTSLQDAQRFSRLGNAVTAVEAKLDEPLLAPTIKASIQKTMPDNLVQDWTDSRADYFHAVQMEKRMMTLVLALIILVAAFNLVSTLVMVVTDKRADIAILRTLGAAPWSIMLIFVIQGAVSGALGTLAGLVLGVLGAWNVQTLVLVIDRLTGHPVLASSVYFLDYLPSDVHTEDLSSIGLLSLALALCATVYPSWRAARMSPVEALRYE
jgi:lipoprotein-releasing system permease protein